MKLKLPTFLLLLALLPGRLQAQTTASNSPAEKLPSGPMPYFDALPEPVPDPIEGFNRCTWQVNDWLFRGLFYPLSFGYNRAVPKPVRTMISNGGHKRIKAYTVESCYTE